MTDRSIIRVDLVFLYCKLHTVNDCTNDLKIFSFPQEISYWLSASLPPPQTIFRNMVPPALPSIGCNHFC